MVIKEDISTLYVTTTQNIAQNLGSILQNNTILLLFST